MVDRMLVTGAGGFIGSQMVKFLKAKGYWVRAVDIDFPEFREKWWGLADEVIQSDLRYKNNASVVIEGVYGIYHFAADHGGAGYFHSEHDYPAARNNMRIDLNILDGLLDNQRLFYASSACAYPIKLQDSMYVRYHQNHKLKESDIDQGPSEQLYGSEKRQMLLFCDAIKSARVGIFSTIYGPGAEYEGIRAKFPTAICKRISDARYQKTPNPKIELWGDGSQQRTFLYIDDALEKIYRVMAARDYRGPVNIGSDELVTVKECSDLVCEYAGIEPNYDYKMNKPTGVASRQPDNSKFNSTYGEVPQTPAKDGFRKTFDWIKNVG